jgi:hypothetical protein
MKTLGKIFASIGKGALTAALFVSAHPEVLQAVVGVASQFAATDKK